MDSHLLCETLIYITSSPGPDYVQNFASTAFIHFLELDQASTWERVRARKGAEARVVPMVVTPNVAGERMELRDKGVENV